MTEKENGKRVSKEWWLRADGGPEIVHLCPECDGRIRRKAAMKRSLGESGPGNVHVAYMTVPEEDTGPVVIDTMDVDRNDYFETFGELLLSGRAK